MNKEKLKRLQEIAQEMVDTGFISGVNCMVLQHGEEVCYYEAGSRNLAQNLPMTRDTIFRIYSMTKPITSVAVMILLEEGRIDLLDPVCKYLPGFSNQFVIEHGMPRKIDRPVTIQNLLNMTSGIVYLGENNPAEVRYSQYMTDVYAKLFTEEAYTTNEIANHLGTLPLVFRPGESWQYGFSADILGAIVEVVMGMSYGEFLKKRIFEPLGMKDTGFYVPEEKHDRLAVIYRQTENGLIEEHGSHLAIRDQMDRAPAFESGGAGLASTIDDYARFTQMLLNKGILDGVRILSEKTVEFMTTAHITKEQKESADWWDSNVGYTYGNLLRIMDEPEAALSFSSKGEYGWDGWLGTYMINDPVNDLTFLMMHQKADTGTTEYTRRMRNVIFSALEKES